MTTRDPRSRDPSRSATRSQGRDPTQSLSIDDDEPLDEPSHPSLALGTHGAKRAERTKIESPGARSKTPAPPAAGRPPSIPLGDGEPERVGQVLGSYKVIELLGKGGMGYVFRAEHVKLGREVALKLLRSDYARRRDAVARFFQEARTVNRVRHRNIVDVTDFVELDDGTTFIIMELLRGQSLGRWARTGIDLPRALAVLVQICDGLGAAHHVGVVHRDLKPDNVIVVPTSDGAELVKLLDFGVAKLLNRDDEDIGFQTAAGSVIGTPAYMSPEQAGGMTVDARSDSYSLGAIMYELFCGQPMFRGRSFGEYVRKHLTEMPVPPRATPNGGEIDPRLEELILRCLEKDPDRRFGDILELRDALLNMLGGMETHPPSFASVSSMRVMPSVLPAAAPIPSLQPSVHLPPAAHPVLPQSHPSGASPSSLHPSHPYYSQHHSQVYSQLPQTGYQLPPRTPWFLWVAGGALAVGLGIGAAVWYAGRDDRPPAPVESPTVVMTPTPVAEPIEPPPPARAQIIELRFESLPPGGVYADGHSVELCRTPCAHNVDIKDGGAPERRTFVVRASGFQDSVIVADLTSTQREYKVTLEPVPARLEKSEPDPVPDRPARTGKKTGKSGKGKRADDKRSSAAQDVTSETKAEARPEKSEKAEPRIDTGNLIDPTSDKSDKKVDKKVEKKPEKKPEKGSIDPSDTLDPFKKK